MNDKTRNALKHIVEYCDKIEKAHARLFQRAMISMMRMSIKM